MVMPWMLSRSTLRLRLPPPPLPKLLPPLSPPEPRPLPPPLPSRLLPCHTVRSDAPVTTKICRTTRHTGRGQPEVGESTAREQQREAMRERQRKRAEATAPACRHHSPFSVRLVSLAMRRVTTVVRSPASAAKARAAAEKSDSTGRMCASACTSGAKGRERRAARALCGGLREGGVACVLPGRRASVLCGSA